MSLSRLDTNYSVKLDPDSFSGTPVQLGGITRVGLRIGNQVVALPTSGEAYARFIALYGQKINPMFETLNVAKGLTNCALSGLKITATTGTGLTTYQQQIAQGAVRTSGANHASHNFKAGLLYPTQLSCEHQGDAKLEYDCHATWDGTNNPVVISTGISLPTAAADAERFTLGPCTLGGILFTQQMGLSLSFGLKCNSDDSDSDIWDTFAWIETVQPTLTLTGVDKRWFDAAFVPLAGLAMTHANTKIYLRKRAAGSTFVANGTAEHIKLTLCGLVTVENGWQADGSGKGTVSLKLDTNYDGTNLPIVINPASAIT